MPHVWIHERGLHAAVCSTCRTAHFLPVNHTRACTYCGRELPVPPEEVAEAAQAAYRLGGSTAMTQVLHAWVDTLPSTGPYR